MTGEQEKREELERNMVDLEKQLDELRRKNDQEEQAIQNIIQQLKYLKLMIEALSKC